MTSHNSIAIDNGSADESIVPAYTQSKTFDKKIVFILMTNSVGGAENILSMLAKTTDSPLLFLKRVSETCLPLTDHRAEFITNKHLFLGFLMLVKGLLKYRKGYTIVSTHPYLNAYLGILKAIGFLRCDLIVRECTSVFTRFKGFKKASYKLVYLLGYRFVDLIICQTDIMRNQLLEHNRFIPEHKALVVANPIDVKLVHQRAREITEDRDMDSDFICTAGRLIPLKGFSLLIQAFKSIQLQNKSLKLLVLGEGPERQSLTNLIRELRLENSVLLKGHISNPAPYFKKAKLCVVSSIQEGFPNVLLEMMAVNQNVVSTLCAGGIEDISDIIKAEANNVEALSEAIHHGLSHGSTKKINHETSDFLNNRSPVFFLESILKRPGK